MISARCRTRTSTRCSRMRSRGCRRRQTRRRDHSAEGVSPAQACLRLHERASIGAVNRLRLAVSLALGSALLACAPAKPIPQRGTVAERPDTFVSLSDVDATILLEMRYFGTHNFMGKRVLGYKPQKRTLTRQPPLPLKPVQTHLPPF